MFFFTFLSLQLFAFGQGHKNVLLGNSSERIFETKYNNQHFGIQHISPFYVNLSGKEVDISKFGYYHNAILSFAKNNWELNFSNPCTNLNNVKLLVNQALNALGGDINDFMSNGSELDCSFLYSFEIGISLDSLEYIVGKVKFGIDQMRDLQAINELERQMLNNYINSIALGIPIDYLALKNEWRNIPNKSYNGAFSAFFIVTGAYSYDFWKETLDPLEIDDTQGLIPILLTDLGTGFVGGAIWMHRHWSEHYMEDFGMRALKECGYSATSGSTGGLWSKLFRK